MNLVYFLDDIVPVNLVIIVNGFCCCRLVQINLLLATNNNGKTATVLPLTPHFWHISVSFVAVGKKQEGSSCWLQRIAKQSKVIRCTWNERDAFFEV